MSGLAHPRSISAAVRVPSQKSVNPPFETRRESESGMVTSEIMQKPAPDITQETLVLGIRIAWPGCDAPYGARRSPVWGRGRGPCEGNIVQSIVMVIIMREARARRDQLTRKPRAGRGPSPTSGSAGLGCHLAAGAFL